MTPKRNIAPVAVTAYQCISAGGQDVDALYSSLLLNQSCLRPIQLVSIPFETVVGEVTLELPELRSDLKAYDTRNARLALKALQQGDFRVRLEEAINRYGTHRVGIVLGTSTSGIFETENAYAELQQTGKMPFEFDFLKIQTAQATADLLKAELYLQGPCFAISTACSSSAKALAAGQRLLTTNVCDAVLVAGVDSLCRLTLRGFHSLQLIASEVCRPLDKERCGINIGEGAALLLLEKTQIARADAPLLLAVGESSDAHHMSAPHPEGLGAALAMRQALDLAGRKVGEVDFINLHATATRLNDISESRAINRLFSNPPPCSGVKGVIGHTLGAAGAIEVVISLLALEKGFLPGTCGLQHIDPDCDLPVVKAPLTDKYPQLVLSNAFGFGGNNACVLLGVA